MEEANTASSGSHTATEKGLPKTRRKERGNKYAQLGFSSFFSFSKDVIEFTVQ